MTPVLKALRQHGLDVVAIHHHMITGRPMVIFPLIGYRTRNHTGERLHCSTERLARRSGDRFK